MVGDAHFDVVKKYEVVGERCILFGDVNYPVRAIGHTKVIFLTSETLQDMFGEGMREILMRNYILSVLSRHKVFSQLDLEVQKEVTASCELQTLAANAELEGDMDIRFAIVLHGEVDVRRRDEGVNPEIKRVMGSTNGTIGEEGLLNLEKPWGWRVRCAAVTDMVQLAIWRRKDLQPLQGLEGVEFVLNDEDKDRILKTVFIFRNLPEQQIGQLSSKLVVQHLAAGTTIFNEGDEGSEFYIIRKGVVVVETGGRRIRTLGRSDYFGERALLYSEPRSATITCEEDCEVWKMDMATYQESIQGPILDYLKDRIALQDTRVELSDLETLRIIGRGGFGTVKMVTSRKTKVRYALKCLKKQHIVERSQQESLVMERTILAEVDHPFMIKFVRSFKDAHSVYFLLELVSGGELLDALDTLGILDWSQARFYAASIILALEFLHARRIAYLDLKSENCLVDCQGYLKLIDFGIAHRITNACSYVVKGTPIFMAPEMIAGKGYTTTADLWSLGVCVYEFLIGRFPFADECTNNAEIFRQVLKSPLEFPRWFRESEGVGGAICFVSGLLSRDPSKRPGAGFSGYLEIKEHEAFDDFNWDDLIGRQLTPPHLPTSEVYAEDKEPAGQGPDLDESSDSDEEWVDPLPGWDADF